LLLKARRRAWSVADDSLPIKIRWLRGALRRRLSASYRLEENPEVGRPFPDLPQLRELIIEFGDSGYVALYRYERIDDTAYVLAFRHQKEAGH